MIAWNTQKLIKPCPLHQQCYMITLVPKGKTPASTGVELSKLQCNINFDGMKKCLEICRP